MHIFVTFTLELATRDTCHMFLGFIVKLTIWSILKGAVHSKEMIRYSILQFTLCALGILPDFTRLALGFKELTQLKDTGLLYIASPLSEVF